MTSTCIGCSTMTSVSSSILLLKSPLPKSDSWGSNFTGRIFLENNELEDVLEYAYQALHLDRYCEIAVKNIAKAYYNQNNHLKAIGKLEEFQSTLKEELGIEPSKEMCAIRNVIEKREDI